ncbi:hypothetical protein Plim_2377 [Planctopirus limnophila DSM 3776]|uniref:Uncharacterized protein n=1 Tax=Planctopirus limnophila (strain ATCC 43296 / DSM 3776 / IFAM 1008 / Mu 290) TaxID=521674 RepID=D5SP59_PLAL2|nr:hypothetical protein Plim_2377 [Planctopirus limnophila DSM 3776]
MIQRLKVCDEQLKSLLSLSTCCQPALGITILRGTTSGGTP